MNKPKILWGITGSVAAIKSAELYQLLSSWADVKITATTSALNFLNTFDDYYKEIVTDEQEWKSWEKKGDPVLHIELRKWADAFLIAPLTANTLAKINYGFSDNLLTNIARAWDFKKPIYLAPAMNTFMWDHPTTSIAIQNLKKIGYTIIDPISKVLACGEEGFGAMDAPKQISEIIKKNLLTSLR